jgi:hypothetical protein
MSTSTIKLLSAAVSVAALIATPSLAATGHKGKASHHYRSDSAYAPQSQRSPEVYSWDGRDLGTDPDPNIRFQLLRDQNWGGY